jgi:glycosyltransferase involved in cell wall biosynthesis
VTQRTLRIALVSEHASPLAVVGGADAGGQNVHVAELARHLGRLGAQVTVHTRRDDPSLPRRVPLAPGVVVDHVDAGPPVPLPKDELVGWMDDFAADLVRCWRAERPDVVHAHFWMSGLAARAAADEVGLPVALTFHALGVVKRRNQGAADTSPAGRVAAEADLARTVDLVIATSRDELAELEAIDGRPRASVVVPCGVDLDAFAPARDGRGPCRAPRHGAGPVPPREAERARIVTVGRLVERKGMTDIIEALALLPAAELLIAGGPPPGLLEGDPGVAVLLDAARAAGVGRRVTLLGAVPRRSMPDLLTTADVVCLTPWYEPFGIVALEAMACGVPVVASAVGGLAETVLDGVTGRLVAPRDPAGLATALGALLEDPALRRTLGCNGLRRASRYGWSSVAAETHEQLDLLARGEQTSGRSAGAEVGGLRS